jgi:hypothetical protein
MSVQRGELAGRTSGELTGIEPQLAPSSVDLDGSTFAGKHFQSISQEHSLGSRDPETLCGVY